MTLPHYAAAAAMWTCMMAVMMLPATVPWLVTLARLAPAGRAGPPDETGLRARGDGPRAGVGRGSLLPAVTLFAGGYGLLWLGFSLGAAGLQTVLGRGALLGPRLALAPPLGGVLLLVAGAYQWAPVKEACLQKCRNPMTFFLTRWRDGPVGSFRMGMEHGLYCLGCCWALMLLAFALGIMSLVWMGALTVAVSVEKLVPGGDRLGRAAGVGMAVWGLIWIFSA